jgi:GT2 family glycosyltransferase
MITIVCVYNSKQVLEDYLINSLKEQSGNYQLILVDNTDGQFKSAAQAYNHGATQVKGKYIMFIHQDVDLCSVSWLSDAETMLDSIGKLGVAGVAGMSETGRSLEDRGRNIILNHEDHSPWKFGHPIEKPEQVQTLDGCLLIVPASVFNSLKFDENVCDNWHLYDVDYCLSCNNRGLFAYVLPMSIYHRSAGPWHNRSRIKILFSLGALPEAYYRTVHKLIDKHKRDYRNIYTSNGEWNTYQPVYVQRILVLIKAGFDLAIKYIRSLLIK